MTNDQRQADVALHKAAEGFAEELTSTMRGVLPSAPRFHAISQGRRVWVTTACEDEDGLDPRKCRIEVLIGGAVEMTLAVGYYCCWDQANQFLAVDNSGIEVFFQHDVEPLFRYEYVRKATGRGWPPGAHFHIHAHHNLLPWLQRLSGTGRPATRIRQGRRPGLAELHFVVGGHRMRPSLEDVLMMVVREFGVDTVDGWEAVLNDGIRKWRDKQLRAAVRDSPVQAIEVLRSLGCKIDVPDHLLESSEPPKLYLP
ncbi:hypothetical protein ACIG3E_11265 [Streptomyces sp. NPDC053474]|uniref:hypothetical protein n=1 Tax=Streptomyces sp. NPDC053474 TaxID=3365704 RepID=UPI0037D3C510